MLLRLENWFLARFSEADFVPKRKARALYYFSLVMIFVLAAFIVIFAIWLPERLFLNAPTSSMGILLAFLNLFLLRKGRLNLAAALTGLVFALILMAAQTFKLSEDPGRAYGSFVYLFPMPALAVGLFAQKRFILPAAFIMLAYNVIFYWLLTEKHGAQAAQAARLPFFTTSLAIVMSGVLIVLLRRIMDKALDDVEKTNRSISRFVPFEFLNILGQENLHELRLGDNVEKDLTILFSDIRGFTPLSERLSRREIFVFVNEYFGAMGPIIRANNGFIDKYIGDALMAIFIQAEDALRAANAMQAKLPELNKIWTDRGLPEIRCGMGIHGGSMLLGTVGEQRRFENTVLSDVVNAAARLEGLTSRYNCAILVSGAARIRMRETEHMRFVDKTRVKGRMRPLEIYEAYGFRKPATRKRMDESRDAFEACVKTLRRGEHARALEMFAAFARENPEDAPARVFKERLERKLGPIQS